MSAMLARLEPAMAANEFASTLSQLPGNFDIAPGWAASVDVDQHDYKSHSSAADGERAESRWPVRGTRPAASGRALDRGPGHPDKGMTPAVGDVLEALNLLETGPLVYGDRPAVERSHGEGIALRSECR